MIISKKRYINNAERAATLKFIMYVVGFILLILLRDVFKVNVPTVLITIYTGICFFAFSVNELVAFCMVLIPFGGGIAISYTLGLGIVALLKKNRLSFSAPFYLVCVLLIWELSHSFIQPFSLANFFRYAVCVLMLGMLYTAAKGLKGYVLIGKSYVYSVIASCSVILLNALSYHSYSITSFLKHIIQTGQSLGNFSSYNISSVVLMNNQNAIGMYCVVAIAVMLVLLQHAKVSKVEGGICISILTIFGLMTGSRTFVIMLTFVIVYYIIINSKKGRIKRLIITVIGFIAIIMIVQNIFPEILEFINKRFSEEEVFGLRDKIIVLYNDYMFADVRRLLFGVGIQSISLKVGIYSSPHNSTQEAFVAWGIFGIILVITLIAIIILRAKKKYVNGKIPIINYMPFSVMLVASQAGQLYGMNERLLFFALVYFVMLISPSAHVEGRCGN